MRGLGARHNSLVPGSHSASPRDNHKLVSYWRTTEASETLLVVVQWKTRYVYTYIYIYIARCEVVVKFYWDVYYGYSSPYRCCGDGTDIDF